MDDESSAPLSAADSTVLGSARQYRRAPLPPSLDNQVSITGATKADPAGKLARQQVLYDPDWASPMGAVWVVMARGYAFSFFLYWLGYGCALMVGFGVAEVFVGHASFLTPDMLGFSLVVGPFQGFILDLSILTSNSAAELLGLLFLVMEPLLGLLMLITHEKYARLRYFGLMFGLVLVKAVVYVLVNSAR